MKVTVKESVIGEPARNPKAPALACEPVENTLERTPVLGLAAHFAGLLLGLFRKRRPAAGESHASFMHQSCIPHASVMHPSCIDHASLKHPSSIDHASLMHLKRPRPATKARTGKEVCHG
jgi:hypothetical protein